MFGHAIFELGRCISSNLGTKWIHDRLVLSLDSTDVISMQGLQLDNNLEQDFHSVLATKLQCSVRGKRNLHQNALEKIRGGSILRLSQDWNDFRLSQDWIIQ